MSKKTFLFFFIFFSAVLFFVGLSFAVGSAGSYKIIQRISLPGNDGWDYISADSSAGRLYVSHGSKIQIVDVHTGKLAGTIENTPGVHGAALAGNLNKGYTSNGRDNTVTVFDLKTLKTLTTIQVPGQNPDAVLFDGFSRLVFTFNGRSSDATVIDAVKNLVIKTIPLEGKPEFSVSDGAGNVFVNIEDKNMVDAIDVKTLKVIHNWPLGKGEEPTGLAIDTDNHRLFIVCHNRIMVVMDSRNGVVITNLPIGERVDGTAFDPGLKRVYSSNGEGTMTVVQEINPSSYKVIETVKTVKGARTMTVDTVTHHLYLPAAEFLAPSGKTQDKERRRPELKPDSFVILDVSP